MRTVLSALFLFVLSLTLLFPNEVLAKGSANYMNAKLGYFSPADDLDDAGFDGGFTGEIAFGRRLCKYSAIELGIGYYETGLSETEAGYPAMGYMKEKSDITVVPITLTLKALYTFRGVAFYGGIGGGLYFADLDTKIDFAQITEVSMSDGNTVTGAHLVIGFDYSLGDRFFLGVEGKRIWTDDAKFEVDFLGIPLTRKSDLNGASISAVAGFRF